MIDMENDKGQKKKKKIQHKLSRNAESYRKDLFPLRGHVVLTFYNLSADNQNILWSPHDFDHTDKSKESTRLLG